jgi:hypothetical protein
MRSFINFENLSGVLGISETIQGFLRIFQEFWVFEKNQENFKNFFKTSKYEVGALFAYEL